jgi:phospholipid/cholesterol/gamma-HCH transport system substrate-binding protein
MEPDKHYFLEGLFIIALTIAAAFAFVWLAKSGNRDDVLYRIHFAESVSGLALGDPVKFHGVDVGTVKAMAIDNADPRLVEVDVSLRKDAPIKTDTRASLKLKGLTGTVYIDLDGGSAKAQSLVAATPQGQIPEIPSEKSKLTSILDAIPNVIEKFSSMESKATKVLGDVGKMTGTMKSAADNVLETTEKVKENPSLLIWKQRKKESPPPEKKDGAPPEERNPAARN